MIDKYIEKQVDELKVHLEEINRIMSDLYKNNVETRIAYKDSEKGKSAYLDLWRVTEHIDYLKKEGNG